MYRAFVWFHVFAWKDLSTNTDWNKDQIENGYNIYI